MRHVRDLIGKSRLAVFLIFLLLSQSCTITRPIFAYDNPARIPTKLSGKDVGKRVRVELVSGEIKTGKLADYTDTVLVIAESQSKERITIPYQEIRKVEIKQKNKGLILFAVFLVIGKLLYEWGQGLFGAYAGMGY